MKKSLWMFFIRICILYYTTAVQMQQYIKVKIKKIYIRAKKPVHVTEMVQVDSLYATYRISGYACPGTIIYQVFFNLAKSSLKYTNSSSKKI